VLFSIIHNIGKAKERRGNHDVKHKRKTASQNGRKFKAVRKKTIGAATSRSAGVKDVKMKMKGITLAKTDGQSTMNLPMFIQRVPW